MPASRISGDRRFLILLGGVAALLLLAAMLFSASGRPGSRGYPSSYSRASDGSMAAFLLLEELDFSIERWEQPPTDLPEQSEGTVLILAEPFVAASAEERMAIKQFVARGGTVLATGMYGAKLLPDGDAQEVVDQFEWQNLTPRIPTELSRKAPEIRMDPSARWTGRGPAALEAFGQGDAAHAVVYRHGAGRVVWWASSSPLTNAGIRSSHNLQFFLNSIQASDNPQIFWDEYFHGVRRTFWDFVRTTPAPWALLQFALVFAAALLTFSRRHGPLRAALTESRLHPLEFVMTLGSLYQHAKATPSAVAAIYQRFRFRLLHHLGLPASASAASLAATIRERRGEFPELPKTLEAAEQCARGAVISEQDAVELARRLQEFAERLRLNGTTQKGKSDA